MTVEVLVERFTHPLLPEAVNRYRLNINGATVFIDAGLEAPQGGVVVVTHYHWDHTLGLARSRGLRVCMSPETLKSIDPGRAMDSVKTVLEAVGYGGLAELARPYTSQYGEIKEALAWHDIYTLNECPAPGVEAIPCPGHSGDHHCILAGGHVFLGDNYVPYTLSTTLTSPMDYMGSMHRVLSLDWDKAYPGHGDPGGKADLAGWLTKVLERKMARIAALARLAGEGVDMRTALHRMYPGVEGATLFLAARNLVGYARALEELGVVRVDRGRSPWVIGPP